MGDTERVALIERSLGNPGAYDTLEQSSAKLAAGLESAAEKAGVQVGDTVQVQPVPAMDTSVKPDGTVSVTVTIPLVDAAPAALDTVTV